MRIGIKAAIISLGLGIVLVACAQTKTNVTGNPWEIIAKIRNGHPGHAMITLQAFSMDDVANVLAYAQTLPTK